MASWRLAIAYGTVVVSLQNRQYSSSPCAVKIPSGLPHCQSSLRRSSVLDDGLRRIG
jgi:hypothetical protein